MAGPPDTPDAGAFHSVSGHWILGSTGHWPVPSGDSPDGMGSTSPASKDEPILGTALLVPVGGSPTGTGGSPVLPRCSARRRHGASQNAALLQDPGQEVGQSRGGKKTPGGPGDSPVRIITALHPGILERDQRDGRHPEVSRSVFGGDQPPPVELHPRQGLAEAGKLRQQTVDARAIIVEFLAELVAQPILLRRNDGPIGEDKEWHRHSKEEQ